jgi:serine phosphatase RsbU (regulator of sigma subunit)
MSAGAKVGLIAFVTSAAVIALAILPGMKSGGASDGRAEFEVMGSNAARAFAAALAKEDASGSGAGKKDLDSFLKSAEEQLKTLKVASDGRESVMALMGVALALAADPSGASAKAPLDQVINGLDKRIEKTKDDDEKTTLRTERNRLVEIYQKLGSAGPAPVAGAKAKLRLPGVAGTSPLRAIWLANPKGEIVGESTPGLAWPPRPAGDNSGRYTANVGGVATTVFYAQGGAMMPIAFLAFDDPAPKDAGGGSKLGLLMLILGPILIGAVGFAVANAGAKPIKDLSRELDRLGSSGDPTRRINARGAEASAVARSVERMVANLKFRDTHAMQDLGEVVSKEQELAGQIHHGLMPKDPPRLAGYEVETLFKPGFEIGGDHFDYFRIDETHLGVILMDTSVRGIPAALVMAMARAYVRAEAPGVHSPADVLMKVNRLLAADLSQGQYVTALYVVIDTTAGVAKVASAGHLPLVVYRHSIGKTAVVNPQGIALGLDVGPVFDREITEVEVEVGVGDRLVLHTDGALKVQSDTGDEYGEARLYASIKQEAPKNSQAFVNFVGGSIDQFHLTTPQNDDITISTVKRLK